jgi:hypothetical protein
MWFLIPVLLVVVLVVAAHAPDVGTGANGMRQDLPPNDVVQPTGAAISSPATSAGMPAASAFHQTALGPNFQFAGLRPAIAITNALSKQDSTMSQTPGAILPDGGKELATRVSPPLVAIKLGSNGTLTGRSRDSIKL